MSKPASVPLFAKKNRYRSGDLVVISSICADYYGGWSYLDWVEVHYVVGWIDVLPRRNNSLKDSYHIAPIGILAVTAAGESFYKSGLGCGEYGVSDHSDSQVWGVVVGSLNEADDYACKAYLKAVADQTFDSLRERVERIFLEEFYEYE